MPLNDEEIQTITPLDPPLPASRGPEGRRRGSETERDPLEVTDNPAQQDFTMLDRVRGCLIRRSPFAEPLLALEILDGPYRGVVFSYASFTMLNERLENGMIPTTYETEVHRVPEYLKASFVKDESFDLFTSEIVVAWLSYLHTNDLSPLIKMRPLGSIH